MKKFSTSHFITFKWIYSESGHGKGVPDEIGSNVKEAIQDIVTCNPGAPIYNVEDLLRMNMGNMIPSIVPRAYQPGEDINTIRFNSCSKYYENT